MFRIISTLFLTFLWQPAHSSPAPSAALADRVVATVNNTVVTRSDLQLHAALAELDPSFVPILQDRPEQRQQDVIDVAVLRSIAGRVPVYQPKPHQIRARVSRFRSMWRNNQELTDFLALHGLEGERLPSALQRRMIIERVVHRNFGPPSEDTADWSQRFEKWMEKERKTTRIRIIPPQAQP